MKKKNYLKLFILLIFPALLFSSCNEDSDDSGSTVYCDAVFLKKKIDGEEKICANYYANCVSGIKSATVKTPNNNVIELGKYQNSSISFYKEPADSVYTIGIPGEGVGTYTFSIIRENGDTATEKDVQSYANLAIAEIDSMSYSASKGLYVDWDSIRGVSSYVLNLYDSEGNTVFSGKELKSSYSYSYLLYGSTAWGSWSSRPTSDNSYTVRIYGRKYDSDATSSDYLYNVQEISISDSIITWP